MNLDETAAGYVPINQSKAPVNGDFERWKIDTTRSRLTFVLRHLIIHEIQGRFSRWSGTLYLNRAAPQLSSVEVSIELASIDTESIERDQHICSSEFLDVARFPCAEFKSTSIQPGDGTVILSGRLNLHGVSHDLELEVVPRALAQAGRSTYIARGNIDRQVFGLHWNQDLDVGGIVVGDQIAVSAELEVVRDLDNA